MKVKLFVSILILWIVNVLIYYTFNYPEYFSLFDIITQHVEWKPLLSSYGVIILITAFFCLVFYKKISFSRKLISSIIYINVLCAVLSFSYGSYRFYINKQELDESILSFQDMARDDIKKDKIREFGAGLPLPPRDKSEYRNFLKKDSIKENYGLISVSYCTISESLEISKAEYRKITEPYLEKRNGKNWREKMKKDIDAIK